MNKFITTLVALLAVQLIVSSLLFVSEPGVDAAAKSHPLLGSKEQRYKEIVINDGDNSLALLQTANGWQIKSHPELPLVPAKVKVLTEQLVNTEVTWPVTTSTASHQRFKVADKVFEKQLSYIADNGDNQTLLLGNSPGYKQLYVRNSQNDDVYNIEFSVYQFTTDIDSWFDKSLLAVDKVSELANKQLTLLKSESDWQLVSPGVVPNDKTLDSEKLDKLADLLSRLSVSSLVNEVPDEVEELIIKDATGQSYRYLFAQQAQNYLIKRDDFDYWFSVAETHYQQLAAISLDSIFAEHDSKGANSSSGESGESRQSLANEKLSED